MWESATELNPRMADAHGNLAKAALNDGDIKKAFEVLQRAVKVVPDNAALYTQLGGLYTASGRSLKSLPISDRKSAVKIAKTAASLSPLEPGLWNNLGLTLVASAPNTTRPHSRPSAARCSSIHCMPIITLEPRRCSRA